MENLKELYEQRLNALSKTFLYLLQTLENNKFFVNDADFCHYRLEYLGEIIKKTLQDDQEKIINKLQKQIADLKYEAKQQGSVSNANRDILTKSLKYNTGQSFYSRETKTVDESDEIKIFKPSFIQTWSNESSKDSSIRFKSSTQSALKDQQSKYSEQQSYLSRNSLKKFTQPKGKYSHLMNERNQKQTIRRQAQFENQESQLSDSEGSECNYNFKYLRLSKR